MAPPLTGAVVGATCASTLFFVNPHSHQVFLPCPLRMLTGLYCPFCGGLRMVHDVLHGDIVNALHDNALALPLVLLGGLVWLNWAVACWRGRPVVALGRPRWMSPVLIVVLVGWTVVRNLPFGPLPALHP
jgi:hypothetical protein